MGHLLLCVPQVLAMGELIKQGKIKYWGVSNETTFGEWGWTTHQEC
jgi:aryl-alcohol dehydrogenase-like predicted oxidoreductase